MSVRNFLTEPDRDMLIENENIPYGRISPIIMKNLYQVLARMSVSTKSRYVNYSLVLKPILTKLGEIIHMTKWNVRTELFFLCVFYDFQLFNSARYRHVHREQKCSL